MNLIYVSIAIFALAAVFGLAILVKWLLKKDVSKGVVYTHGVFSAVGLVILIIYAVQNPSDYPNIALILFIVAALGGFYMFFRDLQNKMSPYSVAFVHGLLAVAAFVSLLVFAIL